MLNLIVGIFCLIVGVLILIVGGDALDYTLGVVNVMTGAWNLKLYFEVKKLKELDKNS